MKKRKNFSQKEEADRYMHLVHRQLYDIHTHDALESNCPTCSCRRLLKLHLLGHEVLLTTSSDIDLFCDGHAKFRALFQAIRHAKHSIHLEYYIIRHDQLGIALQKLLIQKAHEGVEVLLLYDAVGCHKLPLHYFKKLKANGIKVACFFPTFLPFITLRLNYRNHRKLCIIDGTNAFVGGFNIGTEYLGLNKRLGYWRDTHLRIVGEACRFAELQFMLDWRFATGQALPLNKWIASLPSVSERAQGIPLQLVTSGPDSKYHSIQNGYIKMITEARESIYIQTPYFIPDEALLTSLKLAALSGVDVRIMIPNKPDHHFVYWATWSYIGELLHCGCRCFTYEKGFLHAKAIIIDNVIASIGTANFDIRSFKLNFEINAFIYDSLFATRYTSLFFKDLEDCKELTLDLYLIRPLTIKCKESISRLLSPIL